MTRMTRELTFVLLGSGMLGTGYYLYHDSHEKTREIQECEGLKPRQSARQDGHGIRGAIACSNRYYLPGIYPFALEFTELYISRCDSILRGMTNSMDVHYLAINCKEDSVNMGSAAVKHLSKVATQIGSLICSRPAISFGGQSFKGRLQASMPASRGNGGHLLGNEASGLPDIGESAPTKGDLTCH